MYPEQTETRHYRAFRSRDSLTPLRARNGQVATPLPQVYCCEQIVENQAIKPGSLHAKCIVVDNAQAFVSSANFTAVTIAL